MRIMEDVTNTIEIKKSKFITYLHRTNDEQEAKEFLKQIKKKPSPSPSLLYGYDHWQHRTIQ
jgi:putative IMPACT (imprinted ancient) family translation regulator